MNWTPSSWRKFPIKQQPTYEDENALKGVEVELSSYPPLIFAGEARTLKEQLAAVGRGEAFLLQGGDCAESFSDFNTLNIKNFFKLMLQMNMVMMYSTGKPVVKVGVLQGNLQNQGLQILKRLME
jgi:3-deoxy-7-phosphoheptulonate synthase